MNIGTDSWTDTQLANAYTVANQIGDFKLFISFDFQAAPGFSDYNTQIVPRLNLCKALHRDLATSRIAPDELIELLSDLKNGAAALYDGGKPMVSTFSSDDFSDWSAVRKQVPAFELIPFIQPENVASTGADGWVESGFSPIPAYGN